MGTNGGVDLFPVAEFAIEFFISMEQAVTSVELLGVGIDFDYSISLQSLVSCWIKLLSL